MAEHRAILPSQLCYELTEMISKEAQEIQESVNYAAKVCAYELKDNIKADSPVKTGDYKKGWKVSKRKYTYVVHNASKEKERTFLLEYGHAKRNGGRVAGIPHIGKNEERAAQKFEEMCIDIVAEGVRYTNDKVPKNL